MRSYDYNVHAFDRKLAAIMGLMLLVLMMLVLIASSFLFSRQQKEYNDRLSIAIAVTISESIGRVSFSGKFHTRRLVSELASEVREIAYISVEKSDNVVFAHSDHDVNDTLISVASQEENQRCRTQNLTLVSEKILNGLAVNEVVIPYRGGLDDEIQGIVRIGIDFTGLRRSQAENFSKMLFLIGFLTFVAIFIAYKLSRRFGRTVRFLASQLKGILDHAPMGLIVSRKDGTISLASKETGAFFPSTGDVETVAELHKTCSLAESDGLLDDLENQAFAGTGYLEKEIEVIRADEKREFWHIGKFPIEKNEKGENTLICSFFMNTSEKHAAEERLSENAETFRRLFENSSDAIILMKDGRFVECNRAALNLTGFESKEQLIGLSPAEISSDLQEDGRPSAEKYQQLFTEALDQGYGRFEWLFKKADGSTFFVDIALTPIVIRGVTMVHMTWRDISGYKKAAFEKEKLQEQLLQAQKMDAVGQLAGGVAHDFNNILSGIMGAAELMRTFDNPPEKQEIYLKMILTATQKAADLTRKLLTFARKRETDSKPVDVAALIDESIEIFHRTLNKNINISFEKDVEACMVMGDETMLQNVFLNLGINASHAMPDGGQLSFILRDIVLDGDYCRLSPFDLVPGRYLEVEVRDNGCGMTVEIQKRIFEPFFTTKERGKGTGLGLAMAYGVVKDHAGAINVYSEVGVGTVFHVYLPLACVGNVAGPSEQSILRGTGKILLVDDEDFLRSIGRTILESLGYEAVVAADGREAVDIFSKSPEAFDLVILDMIMPVMGGKEALINLKKIRPDCRVIVSSGFAKEDDLSEMEHLGISGFLRKPFRMADLSQNIARALQTPNPGC
ncbi:MAG: response regulator [Candidatus Riflebacteria bacterium]|nr:response regulator [Candidatus Riflebacteria bacterium]